MHLLHEQSQSVPIGKETRRRRRKGGEGGEGRGRGGGGEGEERQVLIPQKLQLYLTSTHK